MPAYSYICMACESGFEVTLSMSEYDKYKPKCPNCKCQNKKKVHRNLQTDLPSNFITLSDDQIKLGHLAKRNSAKLSADEKQQLTKKHNEYRYEEPKSDLPNGMSRVPVDKTGQKIASTNQRKRKPSKKKDKS